MERIDPRRRRSGRGRAGFTLIELMVAMVVLALGMFSVLQLQVYTVRGHAYAREKLEALRIAQGVVEELRTRSLEWVEGKTVTKTFDQVFNTPTANFPVLAVGATPPAGTNLDTNNLFSVTSYLRDTGGLGARYALTTGPGDTAVANAVPANMFGAPLGTGQMEGQRTVYRVHLTGHYVRTQAGTPPNPNLVRMTVFVSWDNKDFGEQYDWNNWWSGGDNFFRRHMVALSFYLFKRRIT
jgi:prepilin-type N-terminal cleavage/methylation domain-containing protein